MRKILKKWIIIPLFLILFLVPNLKTARVIYAESTSPSPSAPCAKGLDKNGQETAEQNAINKCLVVDTAIGPLRVEPQEFIKSIFGLVLSLSGGIALILIIISGYRLMASRGNPEALQGAQEQLTSAIIGLLFIIFSLVILEIIGVDILKIPGFS